MDAFYCSVFHRCLFVLPIETSFLQDAILRKCEIMLKRANSVDTKGKGTQKLNFQALPQYIPTSKTSKSVHSDAYKQDIEMKHSFERNFTSPNTFFMPEGTLSSRFCQVQLMALTSEQCLTINFLAFSIRSKHCATFKRKILDTPGGVTVEPPIRAEEDKPDGLFVANAFEFFLI